MTNWLRAALLALWLVSAGAGHALAETRVALVIGNSAYRDAPRLTNPANDGPGVAAALKRAGFSTVTVSADLDYDAMRRTLRAFAASARSADLAVVYYAGHGMEIGGENYLIPVDAKLASDGDVKYEAVPLALVTEAVSGARRLGLVMLDACRNNPFEAKMRRSGGATREISRGLTRIEPTGNTLVVYAARDGTTAADGSGGNSPFAAAVIRILPSPGLEISLMFRQVRDEVMRSTANQQQPFVYGSLGGDPIYLVAPNSVVNINVAAPSPSPFASQVQAAVDLAHRADKEARDKASEARTAQAAAHRAASAARVAAQRGERTEPGTGVLTGTGVAATGAAVTWRYVGEVSGGVPEGLGVRTWSDGFRQEGEWSRGKFNGEGITTDPKGNFVVGLWRDDAMLLVVEVLPDGVRFEGEYTGGRRSLGVLVGGPNLAFAEQSGQWSASGLGNYGVVRWRDGSRSEGAFADGRPHGPNSRTDPRGEVAEQGLYQAGRLVKPLTP